MFHHNNNLFFGRFENGDVRILKFDSSWDKGTGFPDIKTDYDRAILDVTMPSVEWISIISCMTIGGEHQNYDLLKVLHGCFESLDKDGKLVK